jgi:hypothetical protein
MSFRILGTLASAAVAFTTTAGGAQQKYLMKKNDVTPAAQAVHYQPINIKALPKNISGEDLQTLMRRYVNEVGVPCGYCHAENTKTGKLDFASDESPLKETARFMIKMTDDINAKYLAQLGDRRYSPPFTCGSCHQGQPQPPDFVPKSVTTSTIAKP